MLGRTGHPPEHTGFSAPGSSFTGRSALASLFGCSNKVLKSAISALSCRFSCVAWPQHSPRMPLSGGGIRHQNVRGGPFRARAGKLHMSSALFQTTCVDIGHTCSRRHSSSSSRVRSIVKAPGPTRANCARRSALSWKPAYNMSGSSTRGSLPWAYFLRRFESPLRLRHLVIQEPEHVRRNIGVKDEGLHRAGKA